MKIIIRIYPDNAPTAWLQDLLPVSSRLSNNFYIKHIR